jgi:CRP/FNR family transcriptional regulator, cyclic AMP receptor protein
MKRTETQSWRESSAGGWARVLATFPLFAGLSRRQLRRLARQATFAEFAPGDIVMSNPESTDWLNVILSGSAKVLGKPAARRLRTGDYFGELGLLENAPRSATVVAVQELHVMRLPRHSVLRLARNHPAVALTMLRDLSTQFRRREAQTALVP